MSTPITTREDLTRIQWFAMSAYKNEKKAEEMLKGKDGLEYFIPKHYAVRVYHGVKSKRLVPVIPNLVFVHASRKQITDFKKKYNFLQFMMWEKSTGLKYIVVPDKQMESFIKIASQYEENTIYYKPEEIDIRKGTHICIYGGKFNGVKGVFMRVKGKRRRRVVVMLEGIMGISVEVHPDLIEVINDSVTVFTPVYNRKNLIGNLYQSLLSQTYKNFEWIIVDDGSTDDIDEIIKSYQNEDRILIRFIKQENGGKHRAINNGVLHAKGELFYIVDSDDYLTKDSIERIVFHYQYIKNNDKFAGVCGMKCFPDGSRIGKEVTWKILKDSWINYWIIKNIKGDVAFVFKTSVLRNYLFDDIPGEKFCAESLVLNRIGKNYLMLFFNEKIYIAEYLSDGLSVSSIKNRMNSPNYAMRIYSEMASLDIPYLKKIKAHINYWRFAPCSKLKMKNKIKQIGISSYIIFMPIGYLFHMKDKKNNYIDIRHVGSKR